MSRRADQVLQGLLIRNFHNKSRDNAEFGRTTNPATKALLEFLCKML